MTQATSLFSPISVIYYCLTVHPQIKWFKTSLLIQTWSCSLYWTQPGGLLLTLSGVTHVAPASWELSWRWAIPDGLSSSRVLSVWLVITQQSKLDFRPSFFTVWWLSWEDTALCGSAFQASAGITFTNVPLAKMSLRPRLKSQAMKPNSRCCRGPSLFTTSPLLPCIFSLVTYTFSSA